MRSLISLLLVTVTGMAVGAVQDDVLQELKTGLTGSDAWGGRAWHPAKVHAIGDVPSPNLISLRGEWDFVWFKSHTSRSTWEAWFLPGQNSGQPIKKMMVPGYWQESFGEPGNCECASLDHSMKRIRHTSAGMGFYRREVMIPAGWKGKRVWIKLGGITAQGWVVVNRQPVAMLDNLCLTRKYDITDLVKPGEKSLFIVIADSKMPTGKNMGEHQYGGIDRDIELEATPENYIDDAWVRGDFDKREAEVHVAVGRGESEVKKLGEGGDGQLKLRVEVEGEQAETVLSQPPTSTLAHTYTVKIPLRNFRPWSPEHPNLYWATIELIANGVVTMTRRERFGVRKFETRGDRFYLNNRPFFIRGCLHHQVSPLRVETAGGPLMRKGLEMAKACGFNYLRIHTHTPSPEFFELTDELGLMVQPELPYYGDFVAWFAKFDPIADLIDQHLACRRYVSFSTYCTGNEGDLGPVLAKRFYSAVKRLDPERLVLHQDAPTTRSTRPEHNLPGWSDFVGGPMKVWPRGSVHFERPFITHEYMSLNSKFDATLEPRFTGIWLPPVTMAERTKWLENFSLDASWIRPLELAAHRAQAYWQKFGLESARIDPYCGGYSFQALHDLGSPMDGQYIAQGMLNCFNEIKSGGWSTEELRRFNSPECVLLDFVDTNVVYVAGEQLKLPLYFANYGERDYAKAVAKWTLKTAAGATLLRGKTAAGDQPAGPVRPAGTVELTVPSVTKPTKVVFEVRLGSTMNAWERWIFPRRSKRTLEGVAVAEALMPILSKRYDGLLPMTEAAKATLVIGRPEDVALKDAVKRGVKAISIGDASGPTNYRLGWWWFSRDYCATVTVAHPALGDFPNEGYLSPLWFRIVKKGEKLNVMFGNVLEKLIVTEAEEDCFYELAIRPPLKTYEGTMTGREMLLRGLDVLADTPEGAWLFDNLVDYMKGK